MYRGEFPNHLLWTYFIWGLFLANILWGVFYLYRLMFDPEIINKCTGDVWFYVKYGEFFSCSYIILLFISFPKRHSHIRNYYRIQNSLMVLKISVIASFIYLINNFSIVGGTMAAKQEEKECLDNKYLVVCQVTFILSWFALKASCIYATLILKVQTHNQEDNTTQENRIELIQILS